tara:strand:+ start:381 stop:605 length:225 start_codon:yes stop_codon:yes gene_type:complete
MSKLINHKKLLKKEHYSLLRIAYGDEWESVKNHTNQNGWCRLESTTFTSIDKQYNRIKSWWWRPKALDGFIGCP